MEKQDIKKEIEYKFDWIKKDLKNTMSFLQEQEQLQFVNSQLSEIYLLALIEGDTKKCNAIIKYRQVQKELEEKIIEAQQSIIKNMNKIVENVFNEL